MQARAYHHGNLRQALVEAALERLERDGMAGVTLRGVAAQVGVSHAAPYAHFRDKDALLAAVAAEGFRRLQARLQASRLATSPSQPPLARMGSAYVGFARAHPALYASMFRRSPEPRPPRGELDEAAQAAWNELRTAIAEEFPETQVPAATVSAWALVHGLASLLNEHLVRFDDEAALVEQVTRLFAERFSAPGGATSPLL